VGGPRLTTIEISIATRHDIPELVSMYTHPDLKVSEDEARWFVRCYHDNHRVLVARVGGRMAGACFWRIEGERYCGLGWVENLWVEEGIRGTGVGEKLLLAAVEDMRSSYAAYGVRLRRVVLTTQVNREEARRLYEKVGFMLVAHLGDVYDDGVEDLFYVLKP